MRQPGMSISTGDKELEFADPKEEATYWKQVAEDLERKWVFQGYILRWQSYDFKGEVMKV